jgi:hypothetical protein
VTNGGSLLVNGGGSFAGDVYVGGTSHFYDTANYYSPTNEIINMFDRFNIKRFSIDQDVSSYNLSVSRYDSLGNFLEKSIEISNSNGIVAFNNTIPSTSLSSSSIVAHGGISIQATAFASAIGNGGALTVAGGQSISKNLMVGGDTKIYSTTQSNDSSSGSLIVSGGVGIGGNLHVLKNTVINGNLIVNGTTTTVESNNTTISENVLVLNSGPAGSKDSGFIVQRYQDDNDVGGGDVVNDALYTSNTIPNQAGMTDTEIKFSTQASSSDDFYKGWWIKVASGFSNNQVRRIIAYNGTTKVATLSSAWTTQNPSIGDTVFLYNKPFVGLIYNEINDRFEFGATVEDPGQTRVTFTERMPIYFSSATSVSTQPAINATTGSLLMLGGIAIENTADASSSTSGGTLTTMGGASIKKALYVGDTLHVKGVNMTPNEEDIFNTIVFNAANDQATFVDMTNLVFSSNVWGFDIYIAARLTASTNLYTNFHLRGVNKGSSWEMVKTYVGDDTGIEFNITTGGQLQYKTQNYPGFTSLVFKLRATVN